MTSDIPPNNLVPVTILTGFLGSGKTTLLNRILEDRSHGLRFAIIENEFGEIGVDDRILSEAAKEEVIEVMNGCICCTVRGDLVVALKNLYAKIADFDAVIIETTGLADPAPVAQTFFLDEWIKRHFSLDGIITVTDAKHIVLRLDEPKPVGVENEAIEQVAFADRILLNKVDLINEEEELQAIERRIRTINRAATIYRTTQSQLDPRLLIGISAFDLERVTEMEPNFLTDAEHEHEHDPRVGSTSVKLSGCVNVYKLNDWIEDIMIMGADLFRYKGVLNVAGMDQKFIFQGVGMIFKGTFSDQCWAPGEKRENIFVFIGRDLNKEALVEGFLSCQCSEHLRFKIDDRVFANVGTAEEDCFVPGSIVAIWEEGNPYRIQLEDGRQVYGPADIDRFVKAAPGTEAAVIPELNREDLVIRKGAHPPKKKKAPVEAPMALL